MADDVANPNAPIPIGAIVQVLDDYLSRGLQFYILPVGEIYFIFYHGKALIH